MSLLAVGKLLMASHSMSRLICGLLCSAGRERKRTSWGEHRTQRKAKIIPLKKKVRRKKILPDKTSNGHENNVITLENN